MKIGKISGNILKRSVLRQCKQQHPNVMQGAGAGSDCTLINTENSAVIACSVHPTVIDSMLKVRYSLEHAINNLACSGCMPVSVILTLLLPPDETEQNLKAIMAEADQICKELQIQIGGGHTEISAAVSRPVLNVTALGEVHHSPMRLSDIRPGMDLLVAGTIAREGTRLLADAEEEELKKHFPVDLVETAKRLGESISVVKAASAAKELGAAALHDVSQGGVLGAFWELCEAAKLGMEADLRKIPIRQETIEICEYFGKNPYCLLSGGALLIAASEGELLEMKLREQGIEAAVVGKLTSGNDRILHNGEEIRYLDRPAQDEIYRVSQGGMSWQS